MVYVSANTCNVVLSLALCEYIRATMHVNPAYLAFHSWFFLLPNIPLLLFHRCDLPVFPPRIFQPWNFLPISTRLFSIPCSAGNDCHVCATTSSRRHGVCIILCFFGRCVNLIVSCFCTTLSCFKMFLSLLDCYCFFADKNLFSYHLWTQGTSR